MKTFAKKSKKQEAKEAKAKKAAEEHKKTEEPMIEEITDE